jgi:hypothetical protein
MRICDATGERIEDEGYVVDHFGTLLYFSDIKYLIAHLRTLEWIDLDGNEVRLDDDRDLLDYFYDEEYYYYTTFDDEDDYDEEI